MSISASQVKELRERTGAGMMECKKALTETDGDMEAAIEHMRKTGMAKAEKKAGRVAAEGRIVISRADDARTAVAVEVACETDFVAGGDDFQAFSDQVAERILQERPADLSAVGELEMDGETVEHARKALIAKIGENITVRRFRFLDLAGDGALGHYQHGLKIGAVVAVEGGDETLARDLAMHVAASNPLCVSTEDVPAEQVEKEKEVLKAQAEDSGKPPEIIEKMIQGRLDKWLAEVTLLGQPFVKDPDTKVEELLSSHGARVVDFIRYEVGEGVEKEEENFAEEVMAQVKGN